MIRDDLTVEALRVELNRVLQILGAVNPRWAELSPSQAVQEAVGLIRMLVRHNHCGLGGAKDCKGRDWDDSRCRWTGDPCPCLCHREPERFAEIWRRLGDG